MGSNIFQCLQQCGILRCYDKKVEEFFFKAKAIAYQKVEDTYENIRIGARGEKLSIAYEENYHKDLNILH